jgi:hypothetical protein
VIVEGADVADEGGGVDYRRGTLSQDVITISMRNFLLLKVAPLVNQMVIAVVTDL